MIFLVVDVFLLGWFFVKFKVFVVRSSERVRMFRSF